MGLIELLQSSGPIALDELNLRSSERPEDLVFQLEGLRKAGIVVVKGPGADHLLHLSPEDIAHSSDTIVELSRTALRRSFAS